VNAFLLAVTLIAQPWAHAGPPKGWTAIDPGPPVKNREHSVVFAKYVRAEPSGTVSIITASHRPCKACELTQIAPILQGMFEKSFDAVTMSDTTVCGRTAARIVAGKAKAGMPTGLPTSEMTMFRYGSDLVTIQYLYINPSPREAVDAAIASLCPVRPRE
jgi:hypothetical protein